MSKPKLSPFLQIFSFLLTYNTNPHEDIEVEKNDPLSDKIWKIFLITTAALFTVMLLSAMIVCAVAYIKFDANSPQRAKLLQSLIYVPGFSIFTLIFPSPLSIILMNILLYVVFLCQVFSI